jgi:hypothetical protein
MSGLYGSVICLQKRLEAFDIDDTREAGVELLLEPLNSEACVGSVSTWIFVGLFTSQ